MLVAAGLARLGIAIGTPLDWLPAPAQGAIGVELLSAREDVRSLVQAIDHQPTHACVNAERLLLAALGGDCRSAVAAQAGRTNEEMWLTAEILSPDGREVHRLEMDIHGSDMAVPADVARILLDRASPELRAMFAP